ncbi:RagB/SusD family nutrient uptake outer membrane protein [Mariniflexile litorale]|uniref:RagB/SusD family nutrient uptake outer membrane protein n=1 Tax=Mariniflexile litorale TaxID=3045158 RepID=A0AAU7EBJ6_9FLAO|nr:RagB/SusD family nutrient uptake outer membrane protein [Mariniflexile sp. KMM 9835]MDQ8212906.1 RagB/SusD family nutrient uptake outer membrane protein [Mariniflexile sp. KMM 9835]
MKHIKVLVMLLLGIIIISCQSDFLEPELTSGVVSAEYYTTTEEVETAVINMYDGIQGVNSTNTDDNHGIQIEFYVTEMRSDNTRTKSQEGEAAQFESYRVAATNGIVSDYYASFYNVIFRANIVLDNLGVVTDPSKAAAFESEAKFVRAYAYFNLVRLFGDLPLVDRVISRFETDIQFTRVSTDKIYDLIISDLGTAVTGLDNTYKTRASKAAAQGLLAKVYLTRGEYLKAQVLCESIISLSPGTFGLLDNYNDVFYTERHKEILFAIGFTPSLTSDSQSFSAEMMNGVGRTSGVNYVTDDAKAIFAQYGGNRTQYSLRTDPSQTTQTQVAKYFPNGDSGGSTGKKFTEGDPTLAGNDWIVLRYADVLLMHVEAIMGAGTETNTDAALTSFNLIRNRAAMPLKTIGVDKITKQELLDERRVELAFENHRLFDLIRFGEAESVLSALSAANGYGYTSSDLLLPIPQNEINISQGVMKQNP